MNIYGGIHKSRCKLVENPQCMRYALRVIGLHRVGHFHGVVLLTEATQIGLKDIGKKNKLK